MAGHPMSPTLFVENPATGERIGEVPLMGPEEVSAAVARARAAQGPWAALSLRERAKVLKKVRAGLAAHADELSSLVSRENGKPIAEALVQEVNALLLFFTWITNKGPRVLAPRPMQAIIPLVRHTRTLQVPYGVVGIIAPWNFPLVLPFSGAAEALMAGNAVVLKPSEHTPLVALRATEIMHESGLPEGLVQVVTGDGGTGAALLEAGPDKVVFTGSGAAGRKVGARCGELLIPCLLELGGKAPAIVLDDADLERTANAILYGGFCNSGQICISIERVYVHDSLHDALVERVAELARGLRIGDPSSFATDVGSMTMPGQREKVHELVTDAVDKGARVLVGGEPQEGAGRFYGPTVLVDVKDDMRIVREEIFGPVVPFLRYTDIEEVVHRANDIDLGLLGYVFGEEKDRARHVASRIEVGQAVINDTLLSYSMPELPFGGVKRSGHGRVHGEEGLLAMCQTRVVVDDRISFAPKRDAWWFPYSEKGSRALSKMVRKGLGVLDVTSRR